jgi:hypothetical protein
MVFPNYGCSKIWLIMVYQLLTACRNSGVIAIILLLTNTLASSATEYVFTAPPEVNRNIVEIPTRDTEYPLSECNAEVTKSNDVVDSHNCICTDCEKKPEKSKPESASTLKTQVEQP